MGVRDTVTGYFLIIEALAKRLDFLEDCQDIEEVMFEAQEIAADLRSLQNDMNLSFELNMGDI